MDANCELSGPSLLSVAAESGIRSELSKSVYGGVGRAVNDGHERRQRNDFIRMGPVRDSESQSEDSDERDLAFPSSDLASLT